MEITIKDITLEIPEKIASYSYVSPICTSKNSHVALYKHNFFKEQFYALKFVPSEFISNYDKFFEGMCNIKSMDHPNIIKIYEIIECDHYTCVVMEFCSNGCLQEYMVKHGHFSERNARVIFKQLLNVMKYLRDNSTFDRYVNPGNILFDIKYNIKVTKFTDDILCEKHFCNDTVNYYNHEEDVVGCEDQFSETNDELIVEDFSLLNDPSENINNNNNDENKRKQCEISKHIIKLPNENRKSVLVNPKRERILTKITKTSFSYTDNMSFFHNNNQINSSNSSNNPFNELFVSNPEAIATIEKANYSWCCGAILLWITTGKYPYKSNNSFTDSFSRNIPSNLSESLKRLLECLLSVNQVRQLSLEEASTNQWTLGNKGGCFKSSRASNLLGLKSGNNNRDQYFQSSIIPEIPQYTFKEYKSSHEIPSLSSLPQNQKLICMNNIKAKANEFIKDNNDSKEPSNNNNELSNGYEKRNDCNEDNNEINSINNNNNNSNIKNNYNSNSNENSNESSNGNNTNDNTNDSSSICPRKKRFNYNGCWCCNVSKLPFLSKRRNSDPINEMTQIYYEMLENSAEFESVDKCYTERAGDENISLTTEKPADHQFHKNSLLKTLPIGNNPQALACKYIVRKPLGNLRKFGF